MQDTKNSKKQKFTESEVLLELNFPIPPNTNNVYRTRGGGLGRYMTDEGHSYKALVSRWAKSNYPDFAIPKKTPLVIHFEFYLGTDKLNKNDWDGLLKLLQDAIFETGGGNDAWIRQATVKKLPAEDEPYCRVQLLTQGQEG